MEAFLKKPVSEAPLVVLDTETTGLSPALGHRVVEVAALRLEGWQEVGRLNYLVNPGRPIDPGAARVHGLRDADVASAPAFDTIVAELSEVVDGALLVAHNASFDAGFLAVEYGLASRRGLCQPVLPNAWLCTLRLARRHFHFGQNHLGNVARRLGVRSGLTHRALNDAYTTAAVLQRMARELEKRKLVTVGDLLHAQGGGIYMPLSSPSPLPAPLDAAVTCGKKVRIVYVNERGTQSRRVLTPLYPTERGGHSYLVAYCHLRYAQRTFRLDRILHAELLEE